MAGISSSAVSPRITPPRFGPAVDADLRHLFSEMSAVAAEMSIPTSIGKLDADMKRSQGTVTALDKRLGRCLTPISLGSVRATKGSRSG